MIVVAASLLALGDEGRVLLRYERLGIGEGEWWRLVTGHFAHLSVSHGVMNLLALAVLGGLFADLLTARDWLLGGLLSAVVIDLGLWWLEPQVHWYVGLSGVLHGLVVLGAIAMWLNGEKLGLGLLIGVGLKLIWEQAVGPLPFTEAASGGPVLVRAHLYGAGGGLLAAVPAMLRRGWPRRAVPQPKQD